MHKYSLKMKIGMKKKATHLIYLIIIISILIQSCNPAGKIGSKFISKKYKTALEKERNSYKDEISGLKNDTTELNKKLRTLQKDLNNLQNEKNELSEKYQEQINSNLSKNEQLSNALKAKTDELKLREKELNDKEQKLKELYTKINKQDSITNALSNTIKNALLGFNSDELSVEMKNNKIYVSLSDKLLFKSGSANIENKGKDALKKLGEIILKNTEIDILIEGHTDNVPIKNDKYRDNWDLSVARATSIVRILSDDYKVPPARLTAAGRGEFFPKASNETSEGKAKNRRTEIILAPKLDELFKIIQ